MFWTTIGILFVLLLLCYWTSRSIVHPGVVTAGIWFVILLIYHFAHFGLYSLSDNFYKAVLLWTCPFCLISVITQHTPSIVSPFVSGDANPTMLKIFKPFIIIALVLATLAIIYRGMLYDSSNIFHGIRQASIDSLMGNEDAIPFPSWLKPFLELANTAPLPICIYLVVFKRDWNWYSKVLLILLITFSILRSNKSILATVGLAFACALILEKHFSRKNIIIFAVVMTALMIGMNFLRGFGVRESEFDVEKLAAMYMLAPLTAFDNVIGNYSFIEDFHGEYTFRAFIKIMQLFDPSIVGNSDPFNLNNWTTTPIPVNVYTVFFPFYEDFGMVGIFVFGLILGYLSSILYKHAAQGYLVSKLIYACMFYTLVFQFFSDNFFQFFWTNFMFMAFCVLLVFRTRFEN